MTLRKFLDFITYAVTGFTFGHGMLSLLILFNRELYEIISLHHSNNLTWYFIFLLVPVLTGLIFYFRIKDKYLPKELIIVFRIVLILQISFTLTASVLNYNYWGYVFKRPTVFHEILNAKNVLTCSKVTNIDTTGIKLLRVIPDTLKSMDNLYGRKDIYYGTSDRIFMTFQDRAHISGHLYDLPSIYKNPELKISRNALYEIEKQIRKTKLIDRGESQGELGGLVTEFQTDNNENYLFAGLIGGQVSNDHYPNYEFLFIKREQHY